MIVIFSFILSIRLIYPTIAIGKLIISLLFGNKFRSLVINKHIWFLKDGKIVHRKLKHANLTSQVNLYQPDEQKIHLFIAFWSHVIAQALFVILAILFLFVTRNEFVFALVLPFAVLHTLTAYVSIQGQTNLGDSMKEIYTSTISSKESKHAYYLVSFIIEHFRLGKSYSSFDENLFAFTYTSNLNNMFVFNVHSIELERLDALGRKDVVLERLLYLSEMELGSFQQQQIDYKLMNHYAFYQKDYNQLEEVYQRLLNNPLTKTKSKLEVSSLIIYEYFVLNQKEAAKALYFDEMKRMNELIETGLASKNGILFTHIKSLFEDDLDDYQISSSVIHTTIGSNISTYRKKQRLSITECAKMLHISEDTFLRWEMNESSLTADELMKVARMMGVTVNELLYDTIVLNPLKYTFPRFLTFLFLIACILLLYYAYS